MVIHICRPPRRRGFLLAELAVAMAILAAVFFPIAYSVHSNAKILRISYQRTLAMEMVDGEIEILAAGEWQAFPEGTQLYAIHAQAAGNLPPGKFELTRTGKHLRLEWSDNRRDVPPVVREVTVK